MKVKINYKKCDWRNGKCSCECGCSSDSDNDCKGCAEVCPVNAITRKDKVIINNKKCIGCGACVEACPNKALSLV